MLLKALPWLRISFATEIMPPLVASVLVRFALYGGLVGVSALAVYRARRNGALVQTRGAFLLFVTVNLAFSTIQLDAYVAEPLWLKTTELTLTSINLDPSASPVRVVQLSDIHIERASYREAAIVRRVNALQPDIIVLTGDYLNLSRLSDATSARHFRQFISQLHAPYGIYAVRGSVEPTPDSMAWLVEGTEIVWLEQSTITVDVRGQRVTLIGVACSHDQERDTQRLDQAIAGLRKDTYSILLYHSPDLFPLAAERGIDLQVSGHTHGGQLRLPLYGAIVTSSIYGKTYERGRYVRGQTTLYVSQGLGLEGGAMPRARFLCRPEIVSLDLQGVK
jgi:predicted MPP superfamily phosphohydrolase